MITPVKLGYIGGRREQGLILKKCRNRPACNTSARRSVRTVDELDREDRVGGDFDLNVEGERGTSITPDIKHAIN